MPDHLDHLLDSLGAGSAPAPPAAFIAAIRRRRRRRRAAQAGVATGFVLALLGAVVLLRTEHPALSPVDSPRITAPLVADSSLVALTRANAGRDPDHLRLPDFAAAEPNATLEPLRVGIAWDSAQVERLLAP